MQNHTVSRRDMLKLTGLAPFSGFSPHIPRFPGTGRRKTREKALIVYFSMPETDNPHNMSREEENSTVVINGKVLGNTQYVAQLIHGNDRRRHFPHPAAETVSHRPPYLVDLARKNRNRTPARPLWERSKRPKSTTPSLSGIPTGGATCR